MRSNAFLAVKNRRSVTRVPLEKILYVMREKRKLHVITSDDEYEYYESIGNIAPLFGKEFFRVNDAHGPEFVTNVEYKEFDSAHAIPELAAAANFLAEHPCLDKSEFPAEPDFEKHLSWLVTTGHAVAFTNGVYSLVEKFPKYGPQWKKRAKKPAAEPVPEPVAAAEPTPVAEPVAAAEPVQEEAQEVTEKGIPQDETTAQLA